MKELTKDHCPWCGRKGAVARTIHVRERGEEIAITAPWCEGNEGWSLVSQMKAVCPPYTPEERESFTIRDWWVHPSQRDWRLIDEGIRPLIDELQNRCLGTLFSCDGHGQMRPYIDFYTEEEALEAIEFFKFLWPEAEREFPLRAVSHRLLGDMYRVHLPMGLIPASPKKTDEFIEQVNRECRAKAEQGGP